MLSLTRRRLIVLFLFVALVAVAGFQFGPGSRAAKPETSAMIGGPLITATMTAAPVTDIGTNGAFVNPGDTLEYTVTINNTGDTANGVIFTDNITDPNLTLVAGSVKASPIAGDDTFPVTGNVRIQKGSGTLLANDIRPTNGTNTGLTVTAIGTDTAAPFAFNTANGGTVTAASGNGSFEYNPPPGFEGTGGSADTFTYTITDPDGLTGTGTVRLDVSGMIWFVDTAAGVNGDGRLSSPYNCLVGAGCFDPAAPDDAGDNIFLYTGTINNGGLTLLANQKLIGQGASATLASITGITLAADSDALPATGGANPTITTTGANGIALSTGGNVIRGLTVGNTPGATKIIGNGFGTVTIGNNTTPDVALSGTGKALDLTNGTFAATSAFSSVATTSSPSHGMQLITVGGTVAFGSTSVSGSTAQGIFVNNSGVNLNFGNTTVGATGGATECVRLETNTGGTRTFGTIGLTNCSAQGMTISGGGNVVATGQTTITNPGSTGLLISSTTAGTSATFANVNSTQSGGTGVQLQANAGTVSFGDLDISPDSGQRAFLADQNTGTISSTSGDMTASANAGPFAIAGPAGRTPLAMVLTSVNLTGATNVGVNVALVSGNLTIGTTTITGGAANLVGLQVLSTAAGGTMNFGNTSVTGTNTVAGVRVGITGQGNAGAVAFGDLDITNTTGIAFFAAANTGAITSTSGAISATGFTAISGDTTPLSLVLDSTNSSGAANAISLTAVSGTSDFGNGTLTATAAPFLISGGTCSTTYRGNITQANNAPLVSITGHSAGTVTFLNGPGTVGATNGTGLQFDNADGLYNFNGITTLNGGDAGIDIINGSAGSFTFNGSTSITEPTGIAFRQDASNASVTYAGTITKTNNPNHAVDINGKTSGSTTFARTGGGQITATTTSATAIDLTNTGGSITFSGGLAITTTSGIGFNATGAGQTVNVCDENPCNPALTGALSNMLGSTTGTALNVSATTIGSNNLEFQRIASTGAPSGIILNATGAGGLKVTGTGVLNTGGVISSSTGPGVMLTAVQNINLSFMTIQNGGDDGIRGSSVVNFTMADTNVTLNGNAVGERGIEMTNLTGSASITNSSLTGNAEDNLYVSNSTGTLSSFNITGSTFSNTSGSFGNDGIHFEGVTGAPNMTISVSNCTFSNNRDDHFQATTDAANTANLDVTFQNNTMTGSPSNLGAGITINTGGNSTTNFDIVNNGTAGTPMMGAVSSAITINSVQNANLNGNITGNFIGNAAAPDSGSLQGDGINVAANATSDIIVLIANNAIRQYANLAGINIAARDNFGSPGGGTVNATVSNNTISNPGTFASHGIRVQSGAVSGDDHTVCANIGGVSPNSIVGSGANGGTDFRVWQRFSTTFRLPGYAGAAGDTAAVIAFIQGLNTGAETGTATGNFTGGAACAQPPAAPPPTDASVSFTGDDRVTSVAFAAVEPNEVGGEIVATTTGWETAQASASVETTEAVIWQLATAEVTTTDVVPVANTPSLLAEVYDKVTSQISPTVYSQETENKAPDGGGTVTVNGSGSGFTIPTNKGTVITFRATISNPTTPVNTFSVSNQGSVSGGNFTTLLTDDPGVGGAADPTVTTVVQPPTISKSFAPDTILDNQQSTLTITINNTNPAQAATAVSVTDVFPANVVVASPLVASTTCVSGSLQDSNGNTLGAGDVGIRLINGTLNAGQSCTVTVAVSATTAGVYVNTTGNVSSFEGFMGTTASATLTVDPSVVCVTNPVVTNTNDTGAGSLRDAIATACDASVITFNIAGPGPHTITLASALTISGLDLTITGNATESITINGNAMVTGPDKVEGLANPVFAVSSGTVNTRRRSDAPKGAPTVTFNNLNITGGNNAGGCGGGIANDHANLVLNRVSIYDNNAAQGAGVCNNGTGAGMGGASLTITNSTISGNTATGEGGGISNQGQGSGNATLTVVNSTIAGNTATGGAGIYNYGFNSGNGVTTLKNTILANGATGGDLGNATGSGGAGGIVSQGFNLATDGGGGFLDQMTDILNTNPQLGGLAFNDGMTLSHHPLLSSPVIDKGGLVTPTAVTIDQRGAMRPFDFTGIGNALNGNGSDIGSVEVQQPTAAGVSIAGRVLTADGRGIRGAIVTVTGNSLETPINVMTGVNGRYTIPDLTAGETYVVTVGSRRFFFTQPSRVITLNDNVADADFVAGQ